MKKYAKYICLACLVCGCSDENSSSVTCAKSEEICAATNQRFDAEHCICVDKTCDKTTATCAAQGQLFDSVNCACTGTLCDKSDEICAGEGQLFDPENCDCFEPVCDKNAVICEADGGKSFNEADCTCVNPNCNKNADICAVEHKIFDSTNCACILQNCDKNETVCAALGQLFDSVDCECVGALCEKDEDFCGNQGQLFDEDNCECVGALCDKDEDYCSNLGKLFDADNCDCVETVCENSAEICAAQNKAFDANSCTCVTVSCGDADSCAAENKIFNSETCLCDLDCDGVTPGHKLSPVLDYLKYSEFGATGDGKTDDMDAIRKTHTCANKYNLKVKADKDAVYYIGVMETDGAIVKTDTDWTGAAFIIDDSKVGVDLMGKNPFYVVSDQMEQCLVGNQPNCPNQLQTLSRHQKNIGLTFPKKSIVVVVNDNVKQYIREGLNQNDGTPQTDIIVVDEAGNVDESAPIMWDYQQITSATFRPMDEEILTLKGGTFTTIANQAESKYDYYGRGINIMRSNVVVDGITHYIVNELDHGAPYVGILQINSCANILVKNSIFTGHKIYKTIGSAGKPVSMGSYDISPARVIHLTFDNCKQTNSILDNDYWGIMGSNFCKDIVVKNSEFSRFDAHQGVANVTIINSKLGHQGLNAIGEGLLRVENSTIYGSSFISLRDDYGSTWHGTVEIKDSTWIPNRGQLFTTANLINGKYSGAHDFGYECYMPETIDIDGLYVNDSAGFPIIYQGIYLLGDIVKDDTNEAFEASMAYPYHVTNTINIKNFSSESGKKWKLSSNTFMYRNVTVNEL